MNVRNENEAIRAAIFLEIIKPYELHFFGRDYKLKPKVNKKYRIVELPHIPIKCPSVAAHGNEPHF